jgi:hypothetical protein
MRVNQGNAGRLPDAMSKRNTVSNAKDGMLAAAGREIPCPRGSEIIFGCIFWQASARMQDAPAVLNADTFTPDDTRL